MNGLGTKFQQLDARGVYADLNELVKLQYETRGFSFLPRQPINSLLAGRHGSRLRGRGLNFEELRRYQPGDDIRTIDWKVTARTGKTYTRVFTEERDRPALLIVDQRLSMFFGSQTKMKSVAAAETAALAAWRVIKAGDRVGAVVFNDTDIVAIRPDRSHARVMQILKAIVNQNQRLRFDTGIIPDPSMLNRALNYAVQSTSHDYLICLISDLQGVNDETKQLMTNLAHHNDVIVALIYDPLEAELPQAGRLTVSDGEKQLVFDSNNASLRQRFDDRFNQRLAQGQDILLKQEIPLLQIHTTGNVAAQIRQSLRRK
ncbi:MAG: DUF58 domain-containing protein [Chroococcidiopsidaceae cyanobacterium CP_BM_RX_35]|nr:DUF58 domain-containing protein [Chroococcidiopsidaceae cyanobacterium CP_BM_RX_35]